MFIGPLCSSAMALLNIVTGMMSMLKNSQSKAFSSSPMITVITKGSQVISLFFAAKVNDFKGPSFIRFYRSSESFCKTSSVSSIDYDMLDLLYKFISFSEII